jgi:hypothetical protein
MREKGGDSPHPSVLGIPALFRKTFDRGLKILKNVCATCCEFSKNPDWVAEDFLKSSIALLKIFKKAQCLCRQFSEKIRIASTSETPAPQIIITVFRRRLVGLCRFSQKMLVPGVADFLKTAIALLRISEKP